MGRRICRLLASIALAFVLAVPMATVAQTPAAGTQAAPMAKGEKGEKRERHPAIHAAIRKLQEAKTILQKEAARDFQGHRAKAVQEIDGALEQLHLALKADVK